MRKVFDLTVLLVEDESIVLNILSSYFSKRTKRVFIAKDGIEALSVFQKESIDMIITDIAIPKMNGLELIKKIREVDENIPIVITSGYYEKDILFSAIELNTTAFISKPISYKTLLKAVEKCNALIEQKRLKEELKRAKEKETELLTYKDKYHTWQEESAFRKQLMLIKDDLSRTHENNLYFSSLYKPKDILSGDSYCTCKVGKDKYLIYIFDAMGKGLSASLTSMVLTSFINTYLEKRSEEKNYAFNSLVEDFLDFSKKQLLSDEILGLSIVEIDSQNMSIKQCGFGMPPLMVEDMEGRVFEIDSNNLPLHPKSPPPIISSFDVSNLKKLLIYSDGIMESRLIDDPGTYFRFLKEDMSSSFCANSLYSKFKKRVKEGDDDVTMVFVSMHKLGEPIYKTVSKSDFAELEGAIDRVLDYLYAYVKKEELFLFKTALQEIAINALEHGTLGLDKKQKNRLLITGEYEKYINDSLRKDFFHQKEIIFELFVQEFRNETSIAVRVSDEGKGFKVSKITKELDTKKEILLCGRGLKVTELYTNGVYFNQKGNEATIFTFIPKG